MSFSGSQQADLMQIGLDGSYSWYLENEGVWLGDASDGSIPISWIIGIALAEGNAYTKAIGEGTVLFPEPEWGFEAGGPGRDIGPQEQMWMGGATGGWIRSW